MANAIVLYASKYGSTEQYARWIAEKLNCPAVNIKKLTDDLFENVDTVVFGGGIYAGKIKGAAQFVKHFDQWYRKRVAVFTVGMTGLEEAEYFQSVLDGNFSVQQQADVCFFHFRGRIDYKQLSFMHRMMMGMLKKMLLGKQEKTESDRQILATYGKKLDGVKCDAVRSLVEYCTP